jgi:hypothetical protein
MMIDRLTKGIEIPLSDQITPVLTKKPQKKPRSLLVHIANITHESTTIAHEDGGRAPLRLWRQSLE